jgi:hypothetical protein
MEEYKTEIDEQKLGYEHAKKQTDTTYTSDFPVLPILIPQKVINGVMRGTIQS